MIQVVVATKATRFVREGTTSRLEVFVGDLSQQRRVEDVAHEITAVIRAAGADIDPQSVQLSIARDFGPIIRNSDLFLEAVKLAAVPLPSF